MLKGTEYINISDFDYQLPEARIAKFPLDKRDQSKLILYRNQQISTGYFKDLPDHIPEGSVMVFNETRVVQARLMFHKESGAQIEIFCLEPVDENVLLELAFQLGSPVTWRCLIGNASKWKQGPLIKKIITKGQEVNLQARRISTEVDAFLVEFSWDSKEVTLSEVLDASGSVPLPPYIKRASVESDKIRYQTIYARNEGSVAAPTAGLHFSDQIFTQLSQKDIQFQKLTLHVGAGTFKPVSTENINDHTMHSERVVFQKSFIENIYYSLDKPIIAVGTTSVRSLESLYWLGCKVIARNMPADEFHIMQWDPYEMGRQKISNKQALAAVLEYMQDHHLDQINGQTQMIIVPGYEFRFINALITNFHMPKSTLLLLVAALIGSYWKEVYEIALSNDFRFLSYGDSCLFFKDH